jgi:hypothetical protein
MRIRRVIGLASLTLVVAAAASCGNVVRSSRAPVTLVVSSLTVPGIGGSSTPTLNVSPPTDVAGTATLASIMKNLTIPSTVNNDVTINRYHVAYRRADGHNTPGMDVPLPFDGVTAAYVQAGLSSSVSFEIVRLVAMKESPLAQIATNPSTVSISMITDVTFFGTDNVGNDVSATGSILINFGNGK